MQFLFPFLLLLLYFPFVWWLLLFLPSLISATGGRKTQSSGSPSCNTKQIGLSPDLPFLLTDFKATTLLSFEALSLQPVSRWMMLEGYPYETPPPHKMTQRPIKAWSLNCNGLNSKVKAKRVLSALHKSQADIIFLQETHWRDSTRPIFNSKRFSTQLLAGDSSKSRGVALLIPSQLRLTTTAVQADPKG